jgi:hypothetical protein
MQNVFTNKIKAAQFGVQQFGKGAYNIVPHVGKVIGYAVVAVEAEPAPVLEAWPWPVSPAAQIVVRKSNLEVRNGFKAHKPGTVCARLWDAYNEAPELTVADAKAFALANRINTTTAMVQFYAWKKFNA